MDNNDSKTVVSWRVGDGVLVEDNNATVSGVDTSRWDVGTRLYVSDKVPGGLMSKREYGGVS